MSDFATPHYTVVFNIFIFLQVFNLLNCRKIDESYNFLEGILNNSVFVIVWLFIFIVQVILGQFGGAFFSVFKDGLTAVQWVMVIVTCLIVIPINFGIK